MGSLFSSPSATEAENPDVKAENPDVKARSSDHVKAFDSAESWQSYWKEIKDSPKPVRCDFFHGVLVWPLQIHHSTVSRDGRKVSKR
ncbi:hypothetical protein JHK87_051316 [Glycine soja]|nr:hypothetical protein JHK87_051316 [Glycine soja]